MTISELAQVRLIRRKIKKYGLDETRQMLKPSGFWDKGCLLWQTFLQITGDTTCKKETAKSVVSASSLKKTGHSSV